MGVTVESCRINRSLFSDDLVLLASSQRSFQRALNRLTPTRDEAGMKISTKNTNGLRHSRNQSHCAPQISGNYTLQHVDKFKYLRVVFTSDERKNEKIDTRVGEANSVCASSIALWPQNGSFQIPQSCQFLNQSLFRSSPMVMNLWQCLREYYPKCKGLRWNVCARFTVWVFWW